MAKIAWSDNISVDGGIIDADHKHLIMISNRFLETSNTATQEELCEIIDDLEHYAAAHFRREEELQASIEYLAIKAQKAEHEELMQTLAHIGDRLRQAGPADLASSCKEINGLIRHWLIDHILKSDIGMKPYRSVIAAHAGDLRPLSDDRYSLNRIIGTAKAKSLKIDGGIIDEDHRALIGLINDFIMSENNGASPQRLADIIKALYKYSDIHFQREEKLQLAVGFPYHDAHKKRHSDLLKELHKAGAEVLNGLSKKGHGLFSAFLRSWLIDHVMERDTMMLPYVNEMRNIRSRPMSKVVL
ncbi:MAG: bacteriohemerythrin [Rhodospirillaceae bacterium]